MLPRTLVRLLVYPLHERLRGRCTVALTRAFRRNDRLSAEALEHLHAAQLHELLSHCAGKVPWYRGRLTSDARTVSLEMFPLLDKRMVRAAGDELRAEGFHGKLIPLATGGSSGEPLRFFSDALRESSQLAAKQRSRAWYGVHAGHRVTDLWGSPLELAPKARLRKLSAWALGAGLLPAFSLSDAQMAGFAERLRGTDVLYGYASALARYARFLIAGDARLPPGTLRLVVSTAEVLLEQERAQMCEAFGAPVANEYGCRDGGLIAHECPRGALHVQHDTVHVEILRADGSAAQAGEEGEITVTNLWARGYPLIRYRTGDRAAWSARGCDCGLPHPVLVSVAGRMADSLVRSDGARVHGLALIYVLREEPGVQQFRCTQRSDASVLVELIAGQDSELEARIRRGVRKVLGAETVVDCAFVGSLAPLASGKHRYVICEMPEAAPSTRPATK